MDANEMKQYIDATFDGLGLVETEGNLFFFYDPDGRPENRMFPFVTIVNGDIYDSVSALSRPGDYRLNIGLTKATYVSWFGAAPTERDEHGILRTDADYAARDTLMPHPHYASHHWVSVVNPGAATLDVVYRMLAEAHEFAARKHANQRARQARQTGPDSSPV